MDTRGRTVPAACEAPFQLETSLLLECLLALVHVGRSSVHTGQNVLGVVRGLETKVGDREEGREAQDKRRGARAQARLAGEIKKSCLKIA